MEVNIFTDVKSFDGKKYICKTCHTKIVKGQTPCQAVCNKLCVYKIPQELLVLQKLEQILVDQRIVFRKIVIMPKGRQKRLKVQFVIYQLNVRKRVIFYHDPQKDQE